MKVSNQNKFNTKDNINTVSNNGEHHQTAAIIVHPLSIPFINWFSGNFGGGGYMTLAIASCVYCIIFPEYVPHAICFPFGDQQT